MLRTSESLIIEEFRRAKGHRFFYSAHAGALLLKGFGSQRLAILIQRTSESLIIEEFRGSAGSNFDKAHEGELDYSMV